MTNRTQRAVETPADMRERIGQAHGISDPLQRRTLHGNNEDEITAAAQQLADSQAHSAWMGGMLRQRSDAHTRETLGVFGVKGAAVNLGIDVDQATEPTGGDE